MYSNACKPVKIAANKIVMAKEMIALFFDPQTMLWCAQVTEAPELKRIKVLTNGIFQGSNVVINAGGQTPPIAGLGLKLE